MLLIACLIANDCAPHQVTNISCILLEEKHFGFYLHGRSAHDHADADMAQLNANLKLEVSATDCY